jgi:hypothetical protein
LQGAGATLALPILQSLMPRNARAEIAPKSFIGIGAWNGQYVAYGPASLLMPATPEQGTSLVGLQQFAGRHTIHHGSLTGYAAQNGNKISEIIDEEFTPYLGKMLMLQGFDIFALGAYHHSGQFGNWHSSVATQAEGNPDMATLDVVIADYYAKTGVTSELVTYSGSPTDMDGCSFRADGGPSTSWVHNPAVLWDKYFANANIPSDFKELVVDRVLEDYKAVQNHPRLGADDRQRVEAHIAHLAETQQKIHKLAAVCNQLRPDEFITDRPLVIRTMNDVIVGLISCGLCHVFMGWGKAMLSEDPGMWHTWSHAGLDPNTMQIADANAYASMIEQNNQVMKNCCLDLVKKLEDLDQLDNSLVVCIQEHSMRGHETWNIPVIMFGSAGGAIQTDRYIDYRNIAERDDVAGYTRFGYPMNQLYATVLNAMGVPASEYEALNKPRPDNAGSPFKPGSGYGVNAIYPEMAVGGPYDSMGQHYAGWAGHDLSESLPLVAS